MGAKLKAAKAQEAKEKDEEEEKKDTHHDVLAVRDGAQRISVRMSGGHSISEKEDILPSLRDTPVSTSEIVLVVHHLSLNDRIFMSIDTGKLKHANFVVSLSGRTFIAQQERSYGFHLFRH